MHGVNQLLCKPEGNNLFGLSGVIDMHQPSIPYCSAFFIWILVLIMLSSGGQPANTDGHIHAYILTVLKQITLLLGIVFLVLLFHAWSLLLRMVCNVEMKTAQAITHHLSD